MDIALEYEVQQVDGKGVRPEQHWDLVVEGQPEKYFEDEEYGSWSEEIGSNEIETVEDYTFPISLDLYIARRRVVIVEIHWILDCELSIFHWVKIGRKIGAESFPLIILQLSDLR